MAVLTRKHLQQLGQHIQGHWKVMQAASDNYPSGHRWYQCDAVAKMSPYQEPPYSSCILTKAHPGECLVPWQDGLWWVSGFDGRVLVPHELAEPGHPPPRLALIVMLGGPNDVRLIEEPDFGVIWDHIVPKLGLPDFGYDTREQFLKWDDKVKQWTL